MTARRPLVVVGGEVKELPTADTVTGVATGTAGSALPAGTSPAPQTAKVIGIEGGVSVTYPVSDVRRFIPFEYLIFHAGTTGIYTLTPLTAGTVEPANAPMARFLADLAQASQMKLVIGQRI